MTLNVDQLLATIREQLDSRVEERYPGYRARLAEAIARLLQAEQAWRRDRTPVNRGFDRECREVGNPLASALDEAS